MQDSGLAIAANELLNEYARGQKYALPLVDAPKPAPTGLTFLLRLVELTKQIANLGTHMDKVCGRLGAAPMDFQRNVHGHDTTCAAGAWTAHAAGLGLEALS
jgi:hypothetical protein